MQLKVTHSNLLTAAQVVNTYAFVGMTREQLPRKGTALHLVPVGKVFFRITWDARKGTYGDRLYLCEHCQYFDDNLGAAATPAHRATVLE